MAQATPEAPKASHLPEMLGVILQGQGTHVLEAIDFLLFTK